MTEAIVSSSDQRTRESAWNKFTNKQIKHLVAGGVAGAVSRTCVSPLERLKILYQVGIRSLVYGIHG